MGDGIINLTNIGWILFLAACYYGVDRFTGIPDSQRDQLNNVLAKLGGFPPAYVVVVAWIVLRVMWALGWTLQLELLAVLAVCNYVVRQSSRMRTKVASDIRRELSETDDPCRMLGKNLPEWVTFPSANRVQWVNSMVAGLWPSIVAATETSIRGSMEPLLEKNRPNFVYKFTIKSANIGNSPIVFNGIQHHSYSNNETTLDISMSWSADDMNICLLVEVPGPDIEVKITDFELRMTARLTLTPHISSWPCFGNMVVSIVGVPEIDFNLKAGKVPLDAVPGLGGFIDDFIRHTLVGMLAYPKGFVIPIVKGYETHTGRTAGALGTLKISLLRVENLLQKYESKYNKSPFYVKVVMLNDNKKRRRGASYVGFDSKLKDVFAFTLFDNTAVLRFWFYIDVVGSDVLIGIADVPVSALIDCTLPEYEIMLYKESDPSKKRRVSLMVKPEMLAFNRSTTSAPPEKEPPREPSPEFLSKMAERGVAPAIPRSRGGTPRSGDVTSGTLFVNVASASDLKNRERFTTSDPYVFLRVGAQTAQSAYLSSTLNPVFNYEAELVSENYNKDVLKISIIDKNDVGKDELMGYMEMPVMTIANSRDGKVTGEFNLDPQGKIKMTLTFMPH